MPATSRDLRFVVHVGQDRQLQLALDLGQDLQALVDAGAAKARAARAVGLVVARLEDEGDAERGRDLLQAAGHVHLQLLALDDAGAGDEEKRLAPSRPRSRRVAWQGSLRSALTEAASALLVIERRLHVAREQRVAAPRRALELGVELHADEPRVHGLGQLDDLGELLALRHRADHQPGIDCSRSR
jgi:hypothetical protein